MKVAHTTPAGANVFADLGLADAANLQLRAQLMAEIKRYVEVSGLTQRQAELETMANLIGRQIQAAPTVEDVLKIAARELNQSLGAHQTLIQIGSPELETSPETVVE